MSRLFIALVVVAVAVGGGLVASQQSAQSANQDVLMTVIADKCLDGLRVRDLEFRGEHVTECTAQLDTIYQIYQTELTYCYELYADVTSASFDGCLIGEGVIFNLE